jgi:protein-S-isoprenylcysteine O-methyltransferase Ste14
VSDTPLIIVAVAIWTYWAIVLLMAAGQQFAGRRNAGLVPTDRRERLMWLVWVPVIVAWNVLPALADRDPDTPSLLALPEPATTHALFLIARWSAALLVAGCLLATIACWQRMGRNWSVAVIPGQKAQLVTSGPFALARHPIYALSMLMMIGTAIVLPTPPMGVVCIAHIVLMIIKARREERFLRDQHGEAYDAYCARVGRFWPRFRR